MFNLLSILMLVAHTAAIPFQPIERDVSSRVLELKRSQPSLLRKRQLTDGVESLTGGIAFSTGITIGGEKFQLIVDTGSSDTWVATGDVQCFSVDTGKSVSQSTCKFGKAYTVDSTFTQIPDMHINGSYGDGEWINGIVGYETINLAGITIPDQEIGVISKAAWQGDGVTSGILGLAFPSISSSWVGINPLADTNEFPSPYPTIMQRIVDNKAPLISESQFALAISRDVSKKGNGGLLIFGEVPAATLSSPSVNAVGPAVTVPLTYLGQSVIEEYAVSIDGWVYKGSSLTSRQHLIDSGTTFLYIYPADANAINALFVPPANDDTTVQCDAKAPTAGVSIGKQVFNINPKDMIFKNPDGTCESVFKPCGRSCSEYILGDAFLRNVLAVFNYAELKMEFQAREFYTS